MDNYKDFSEDERIFYLREAGFDSREKELFRLRVYEEKNTCRSFRNHGVQHKNRRPHKQKIKEENYESRPDVLSGLFFVFIKCGVFMALSWRVNQPLIIVKYTYKNKGGLRYAVW